MSLIALKIRLFYPLTESERIRYSSEIQYFISDMDSD